MHSFFLKRGDLAAVPAVDDVDLRVAVDVAHEAHAARTEDATLPIEHQRRPEIDVAFDAFAIKNASSEFHPALVRSEGVREILQRTLAPFVANRAVERMVDQQ